MADKKKEVEVKSRGGMRARRIIGNVLCYILLILMSIVWLIPFVCIFMESFRMETKMQVGYILPKVWGIGNYVSLIQETDFLKWYGNTLIIGLVVAIVNTFFIFCMSYTLSRLRFKGRKFLMNLMLILGMFPGFLTLIVLFKVLSDLNLTGVGAVPGLILVYTASSAMGYYVCKGFFDTIPKSLDEAARVDGASRAQVMFRIMLPMTKPIVIYTILTAFMSPWGDFMFAKYIAHGSSSGMNVAVGMQNMIATTQGLNAHYTQFCAAGVLVAIPITILFMCLQKYYVEGVTGGAVKG